MEAARSYFDLLWEVEEVSCGALGKVTPPHYIEWRGDDEGVEGGLPSQCVSDDILSEALLGNPFLPLPDEDALQPPPPALPHPETLMQVSLPAGQPAAPATSSPPPQSPAPSSPQEQVSPPASPRLLTGSQAATPSPRSPVRVVVRTGRMVAPVTLEKSSRYLVRIPGATPLPPTAPNRHLTLQEEKPEQATPTVPTSRARAPLTQAPSPSQASPMPDTTTTLLCLPSRGAARRRRCSNSSTSSSSSSTPFRSQKGGRISGVGPDRFVKRKAYELEPQEDPDMERCRQNAINARRNRELKKARMAELEKRVEEGDEERDRLLGVIRELREGMAELQREVKHLRNQSPPSHILDKVSPVRVSHGDAVSPQEEEQGEDFHGFVCLHVDGNGASLENCSLCAKKAS